MRVARDILTLVPRQGECGEEAGRALAFGNASFLGNLVLVSDRRVLRLRPTDRPGRNRDSHLTAEKWKKKKTVGPFPELQCHPCAGADVWADSLKLVLCCVFFAYQTVRSCAAMSHFLTHACNLEKVIYRVSEFLFLLCFFRIAQTVCSYGRV